MSSSFIKIGKLTASQLYSLANMVHTGLNGNALYPTPSVTLAQQQTDNDSLAAAIIARGDKRNYGGAIATQNLKDAVAVVKSNMNILAGYCMSTTPNERASFMSAGWPTYFIHANGWGSKKVQQAAQNLRAMIRRDVETNLVYLKWKKPLGHANGTMIKFWKVYAGLNPAFGSMTQVATTTKTQYTHNPISMDDSPAAGASVFYKVIGVNADGRSVTSDLCKITYQPV